MQIRILPEMEAAEAMTYQDQFGYQEVYKEKDGKELVDLRRKKDLNKFLNQWLSNIIQQKHLIDLSKEESELEEENETAPSENSTSSAKADFERMYTPEEEREIMEQFLSQGYRKLFSAQDAFDQQLPVIDLAFRYNEPLEYFRENIEEPNAKKILKLRKELKELKGKGTNEKRTSLKEEIETLEGEINKAEKLIQNETLIFNDDLFQIIIDKAKEKGYANRIQEDIHSFRDYVITNVLDNRAIENYHQQPVNEVVDELINEYFNKAEKTSETERPSAGTEKANATDLKSGDTFVPNVLVPADTKEPFYSHLFNLYDMKEVIKNNFPHLLKINDSNLGSASPITLFELMQFGHPSEYGIDVSRQELLKEFEKRGKSIFHAIGFPTDEIYPYVNLHLGYESVEPLNEMLFDNNKEGDEWWAIAENCRPVADAKKALKIIDQMIAKEKQEMKTYLNPKTGKPKLDSKHLVRDIELTIENFEDSKEVLQHYLDNPPETGTKNKEETAKDPLTNDSGVYTEKTAGKNYEEISIPMPKGAKYQAEIRIVKTSKGDYRKGISCAKKFGDGHGGGYAPSDDGDSFSTRQEALTSAFQEILERLKGDIRTKDSILGNEENKNKSLNMALEALKEFAKKNNIILENDPESNSPKQSIGEIIKGLENAYWTKEDNKYPQNKATINGMEFQQARLRDAIHNKLEKLPIATLEQIVKELSLKFQEKRPLSAYDKSLVTVGKTGDKRK
ncbi:MAG TPA: hypothetical protein VLB84_14890, partial [Bacteroidia bacterium]|nr:hypothetical protein [Bacteroidia bacterium]